MSYSKHFAQSVLRAVAGPDASVFSEDFTVALLTGTPSQSAGSFNIASVEQDGTGYSRQTIPSTDFTQATGNAPSSCSNTTAVRFSNTGSTSWDPITHVALLDGSTVLAVFRLSDPHTTTAGRKARIPVGGLVLKMSSI